MKALSDDESLLSLIDLDYYDLNSQNWKKSFNIREFYE